MLFMSQRDDLVPDNSLGASVLARAKYKDREFLTNEDQGWLC